jgi:hypothetical protein
MPSRVGSLGPTVYFVAVAAAVVVTEQVLRRRDRGPVTLDVVHAPDEVDGALSRPAARRS